jgi:hypothetical protein
VQVGTWCWAVGWDGVGDLSATGVEAGPFRKRGVEAMAGAGRDLVAKLVRWHVGDGKLAGGRRALEGKSKTGARVLGEAGSERWWPGRRASRSGVVAKK